MARAALIARLYDGLLQRRGKELPTGGGPLLAQIQIGMEVRSAYGVPIGPITAIWRGHDPGTPSEPCDMERCSRLQVQHRTGPLYVPYSAITAVAEGCVTLNVEAAQAARGPWRYRPDWLPPSGWTPPLY